LQWRAGAAVAAGIAIAGVSAVSAAPAAAKKCVRVTNSKPTSDTSYGPCRTPGAYERGITLVSSGLHGYSMSTGLKHPGLTGRDISLVASCATCQVGSAKGRRGAGFRKIKCSALAPGSAAYDIDCKPRHILLPSDFSGLPKVGDPMRDQDGTIVGHIISVEPSDSHDCVPNPQPTTSCVDVVNQQEIMEDAIYSMPIVARASKRARIVGVYEHHQGARFDGKTFTRWVRKRVGDPAVYRTTVSNRDPKAVSEQITLYVEVSLRQ
jgi:hypothetical protein